MASTGNRHCASCIGTLSFPIARQRCTAGSAPGTPRTMDSSSLGARRRLEYEATSTTQQGR